MGSGCPSVGVYEVEEKTRTVAGISMAAAPLKIPELVPGLAPGLVPDLVPGVALAQIEDII